MWKHHEGYHNQAENIIQSLSVQNFKLRDDYWEMISDTKTGIILYMRPANERQHYNATSPPTGWAHTQNDQCQLPRLLFKKMFTAKVHCSSVDVKLKLRLFNKWLLRKCIAASETMSSKKTLPFVIVVWKVCCAAWTDISWPEEAKCWKWDKWKWDVD